MKGENSRFQSGNVDIQHSISVLSYFGFLADTVCGLELEAYAIVDEAGKGFGGSGPVVGVWVEVVG